MFIPLFRDWKIRTKLIGLTLFLVLLPLFGVSYLSMNRFGKSLKNSSEEGMANLVRNVHSMCKVQQEMSQRTAASNLNITRKILYLHGREIEIVPDKKIHFAAIDQLTNERYLVSAPLWKVGDIPLSRDNHFVDEAHKLVGGICTIFQKIEGNRFLCISTNIAGEDGKRVTGTFLPPYSPVAQTILAGRSYKGREYVLDNWYTTACEPIWGRNNKVIGALYVGVKELSALSLKNEIKQIKVGDTGYIYVINSRGTLEVHPAKEGKNIIDSKDSTGFEYIQAMIMDAVKLDNGDIGTIRYPWINQELGEKRPRQKITKYTYFKPWDWIIAAGTYEHEIYQSVYKTEQFILIMVFIGLALAFFLTITLSKVLTNPIQELTEVTTRMAGGDLSERVLIHSADEIGVLGLSFNRMIGQVQHYTSNLEKIVDSRTRQLTESREKYRDLSRFLNSILDSATEYAIMALDYAGKIIEFNKGAEKLFGWQEGEVLDKENISITILPEDLRKDIQKDMSRRTTMEGVCELEMTRVRKNGDHFPAHTIITAITDPSGKATGFVEIVRDLSRRKVLEKELRETKEFLENIMESSVDGIVTTDLKGKITYLNRAMEEMIKYPRDEVMGKHISLAYLRGIQEARDVMDRLRSNERAENYEMGVITKDGEKLVILNSLFLVRDEDAQVIGTAGIFKDITEQKRLESKLKAAQAHLVEASKMRALGELVAGVAHELNNPLMASQTILHVILKNLQDDCQERERLELVRKCNDRIEKIVEHLREFSRQTKPEFSKISINQPIENALMITGQQLLNHNISVVRRLSEDIPNIVGDSSQLEQVFLNLISNARDAMDGVEGSKELSISSYLTDDEGIPQVAIAVKDNGEGIPKENLDKVLDPFFSTKPVGKGTGLGLSLCFGIIEAHEGRIEIESEPGKGTEVKILLPLEKSKKEQ